MLTKLKGQLIAVGCALSLHATAGTMGAVEDYHPWSLIGGLGYTWYNDAYAAGPGSDAVAQSAIGDGQTPFGRFGIARELATYRNINFGIELAVQSGNTQRLGIPQVTLDELGGLPIQATIKPMLDLLVSAKTSPWSNIPAFGLAKVGVAYRRMTINERVTVNDLSEAAFEVQAGLGFNISERANLALVYQGIFDGGTDFRVNLVDFTGHIAHIPNQNGILLTLAYQV